jgi:hypothetical protein
MANDYFSRNGVDKPIDHCRIALKEKRYDNGKLDYY